jgi:hypothetical protein
VICLDTYFYISINILIFYLYSKNIGYSYILDTVSRGVSLRACATARPAGPLGEQLTRAGIGALLGRDSKARTSRLRCFLAAFKPLCFFFRFPSGPWSTYSTEKFAILAFLTWAKCYYVALCL